MLLETLARVVSFPLGLGIVVLTLSSAIRTFVLPRSARDRLSRFVFLRIRNIFNLFTKRSTTYEDRDRIMALYAPIGLLSLVPTWLFLVTIGYGLMFWAIGIPTMIEAFKLSGSSLLTLGMVSHDGLLPGLMIFSEAAIGLILVALLIAYLPTMYSAFSQREASVAMMEVRAGSPPTAVEMFKRFQRLNRIGELHDLWMDWERWFVYVEETHTSLAALTFFRSPQPERSWITAAGAVLDGASFAAAVLDIPHDAQADLCIRAGYIALRRICDLFGLPYNATPQKGDPISISREEFDAACEELEAAGVPLKADREAAWQNFVGWRVNYDVPLLELAQLTMAPYAPWSSDRSINFWGRRAWMRRRKATETVTEVRVENKMAK